MNPMSDYPQSTDKKSKLALRKGIFARALVKELTSTGLLVATVLLGVVVLTQLVRLLGRAVNGLLAPEAVLTMLGFTSISMLPVLLSVSLFLSILMTLTRYYRDSEMVVWLSSGMGLTRWIAPVLSYALPVVALIALLSLVFTPWALSMSDEYMSRLESRDDVSQATPGMFKESKQANRVYFLENVDVELGAVGNVFVRSIQHGREGAMMARQGYQEVNEQGERFLVLLDGTRYEGVPGQADFRIIEFDQYSMRLEESELQQKAPSRRTLSVAALLDDPTPKNLAEFEWRVGLPLSALVLALLAIPLSYVNPRVGRSFNVLLALVIYTFYNNMISVTNAWVGQEKMGAVAGLLGIHGVMIAVMVLLFYYRSSITPWRRWWR